MVSPCLFTNILILGFLKLDPLEADSRQGSEYKNFTGERIPKAPDVGRGDEIGRQEAIQGCAIEREAALVGTGDSRTGDVWELV